MSNSIVDNILPELTKGRPFVFVIMPFKDSWFTYDKIKELIEKEIGLVCIRGDDVNTSGYDLLEKIHFLIERAELIVAVISKPNPNVFYEVGYASGIRKNILLLAKNGSKIPVDIKGKELIIYEDTESGFQKFRKTFCRNVEMVIGSRISLLKDMLLGDSPNPSYIVASPKYPDEDSKIKGQVYDRKTFGDNLGVVGLLSAFGTILGERAEVELISAQYCEPNILEKDCNLYLIGSKRVNPISGQVLELMSENKEPQFYLGQLSKEDEVGDYIVNLYRREKGKEICMESEGRVLDEEIIYTKDYGIIIRGPHPRHKNRIAVIMAGPHALGTGGACIAATRSPFIQKIRDKLPKKTAFSEHDKTIWALVQANASDVGLLDENGVIILEAGVW